MQTLPRTLALLLGTALVVLPGCGRSPTAPRPPQFAELAITTASLPAGVLGEAYAAAVHAAGGDGAYEWTIVEGELPPGMAVTGDDLSTDDALITGTPEEIGSWSFVVRVRSGDGQSADRTLAITILPEPAPLAVVRRFLAPALQGGPFAVTLRAEGGDGQSFTWSVVEGRLPAGLALSAAGRLHGTPTAVETTTFTVEVSSGGMTARREFTLRVVANDLNRYRITVFAVSDIPAGVLPHLQAAVAEWEAAIVGNLQAVAIPENFFASHHCGGFGPLLNGTSTDDILVAVNIMRIDGPGRVLGQAGPCGLRENPTLPFAGIITLDVDDLLPLVGTETLTDIIVHELAHVFGFGTLWRMLNLLQGAGTGDPRFTGARAVTEWQALGGTGAVPLETQGGEGTAESHWRKSVFRTELMTGFVEPVGIDQPLSRVSIASHADLGYTVNLAAADAFALGGALAAPDDGAGWRELGYDRIYLDPVLILNADGSADVVDLHGGPRR
jgi:hypothetical protein